MIIFKSASRSLRAFVGSALAAYALFFCNAAALAQAGSSPCLAPLPSDQSDPQPRDIHFVLGSDGSWITATACIVSNRERITNVGVSFGAFDSAGELISTGGQSLGLLPPTDGTSSSNPHIISPTATDIFIDPKYAKSLLNQTVVTIQWAACKQPLPATCEADTAHSSTFLRGVIFDSSPKGDATRRKANNRRQH